jgi:hypothetical protein
MEGRLGEIRMFEEVRMIHGNLSVNHNPYEKMKYSDIIYFSRRGSVLATWDEIYDSLILKLSLSVESDWEFDEDDLEFAISTTFGYDDRTIHKYKRILIKNMAIEELSEGRYRINTEHPDFKTLGLDDIL